MHIPDGYLGPQTYGPAFAAMTVLWAAGVARLKRTLRLREVPTLALGAAFSFVIMMFNVPIPAGTSGHAVGAVLIAILLGPWAAMVAVSLALIVQALLFGDGGITAIGANCFNMAVVMPFVGWTVYRLIAGAAPVTSARHWIGGAVGGYVGLCAAALAAGVEFGIQPMLAHDAAGRALYCPFGLRIALAAMGIEHLLVFGFVEGMVTALVVLHLQRSAPELLAAAQAPGPRPVSGARKLVMALAVLVLLTPLGLYLPKLFRAGPAWGEWNGAEIKGEMVRQTRGQQSFVPQGLQRAEAERWEAPLRDYDLPGREPERPASRYGAYLLSAAVGVMAVGFLLLLVGRRIARKDGQDAHPHVDAAPPGA